MSVIQKINQQRQGLQRTGNYGRIQINHLNRNDFIYNS